MDFLNTYFPFSPSSNNAEGRQPAIDDLASPLPREQEDENLVKQRNGNYEGLREARKNGEKRNTQVRFLAPISEGESLKSIKLTPKTDVGARGNAFTPNSKAQDAPIIPMEEALKRDKSAHVSIFGFKIKVKEHNSKTERNKH